MENQDPKLVFFNIGWMKRYQGVRPDDPIIEFSVSNVSESPVGKRLHWFCETQ